MSTMSDKDLAELTKHVTKALKPVEKPLDSQHMRAIILLTHRTKEARVLWEIANRQGLTINRFSTWKFCNLLHKVLRDGHAQTLCDSWRQVGKLQEVGNYWWHQKDMVGLCIARYCRILFLKIQFHYVYGFFIGNLSIRETDKFDQVDVCFQLCTDILELLEELLQLQEAIFMDIQVHKIATSKSPGKCRLAPLITITDECDGLYFHCVGVMRILCSKLPPNDVAGLCERFEGIFEQLQRFYHNLRGVQYIIELIQIPELPAFIPNFYTNNYRELPMPTAPLENDFD